jgi:hypothetical protein
MRARTPSTLPAILGITARQLLGSGGNSDVFGSGGRYGGPSLCGAVLELEL